MRSASVGKTEPCAVGTWSTSSGFFQSLNPLQYDLSRRRASLLTRLAELHVLVGAEEAHELRHLDHLDESGLVHIEVAPGLFEVGVDVVVQQLAAEALVGCENFLRSSRGSSL